MQTHSMSAVARQQGKPIAGATTRRAVSIRAAAPGVAPSHSGRQQQYQPKLSLHVSPDTTISVPFGKEGAQQLQAALSGLLQTFAAKQKATKPQRWPMLEWRAAASAQSETSSPFSPDIEFFEVMCNPNAHSTAFEARALITVMTRGGLKVTTETKIPALQADLDTFLSQCA